MTVFRGIRRGAAEALGRLGMRVFLLVLLAAPAAAATDSFSSTGSPQTFTVPAGVNSIHVVAIGGSDEVVSRPVPVVAGRKHGHAVFLVHGVGQLADHPRVAVVGVGWGAFAMSRPGHVQKEWEAMLPHLRSGALAAAAATPGLAAGSAPGPLALTQAAAAEMFKTAGCACCGGPVGRSASCATVRLTSGPAVGRDDVPTVTNGAVSDSASTNDDTAARHTATAEHVATAQIQTNRIPPVTRPSCPERHTRRNALIGSRNRPGKHAE